MEKIGETFQKARALGLSNTSWDNLSSYVKSVDRKYRPIAHEGAANGYALFDKLNHGQLKQWSQHLKLFGKDYHGFICAGLGWAMPKWKDLDYGFLNEIEPLTHWRFFDAWGYHDAFFKRKLILNNLQRSVSIAPEKHNCYDQGIGRQIWYLSLGDFDSMLSMVGKFQTSRMEDVWRGIGIASVFVGGMGENDLLSLQQLSNKYLPHYKAGASLGLRSYHDSHVQNEELEHYSNLIFNMSFENLAELTHQLEPGKSAKCAYGSWVDALQKHFQSLRKA